MSPKSISNEVPQILLLPIGIGMTDDSLSLS